MLCEIKLSCECFNTSVTIEGSYLSVWQPVRVQIGNSVAVLVALVAFFRLLAHVCPHFLNLMRVRKGGTGYISVAARQCVSSCVSAT